MTPILGAEKSRLSKNSGPELSRALSRFGESDGYFWKMASIDKWSLVHAALWTIFSPRTFTDKLGANYPTNYRWCMKMFSGTNETAFYVGAFSTGRCEIKKTIEVGAQISPPNQPMARKEKTKRPCQLYPLKFWLIIGISYNLYRLNYIIIQRTKYYCTNNFNKIFIVPQLIILLYLLEYLVCWGLALHALLHLPILLNFSSFFDRAKYNFEILK